MPPSPNFEIRSTSDTEASFIALASTLKAICEKIEVQPDRIRQFVEAACGDDINLVARTQWFVDWIAGRISAAGERS